LRRDRGERASLSPVSGRAAASRLVAETLYVFRPRSLDRFKGESAVKSCKAGLFLHRQGQEVDVGQLAMTLKVVKVDSMLVTQRDGVRPEFVVATITESAQALQRVLRRPGYLGLDRIRTSAFSVIGQVAHPSSRRLANHVWATEW